MLIGALLFQKGKCIYITIHFRKLTISGIGLPRDGRGGKMELHIARDSKCQGCHWSRKSQGNSRSGKCQGILEFVREICNFFESQGNSR